MKIIIRKYPDRLADSCNALVNVIPHPRGGWGNTRDLTNRGVKFPTIGEKLAVKSPLCPQPHSTGFVNISKMTKRIFMCSTSNNLP